MDPENVRTIVTGVVTTAVGIVPASLLYLQNKQSGDREAHERAEQRTLDDKHRTAAEAAALAESRSRNYAVKRERYLRYSRAVEHISSSIRLLPDGYGYDLEEDVRAEAAAAFEDVMLTPSAVVRDAALVLRQQVDALVQFAHQHESSRSESINRVEAALNSYRQACRNSLRPSQAVESESDDD